MAYTRYRSINEQDLPGGMKKLQDDMAPIVCLCGSTKYKDEFLAYANTFTRMGWIVLMPGVWGHSGDKITEEEKGKLDKLHLKKIMMADLIFIVNINGYIGESTKNEINFAKICDKSIYYAEGGFLE